MPSKNPYPYTGGTLTDPATGVQVDVDALFRV